MTQDPIDMVIARLDRLEEKFDAFVLQKVFDSEIAARDKQIADLRKDFEDFVATDNDKGLKLVAYIGCGTGIISTLIVLLSHFRF